MVVSEATIVLKCFYDQMFGIKKKIWLFLVIHMEY